VVGGFVVFLLPQTLATSNEGEQLQERLLSEARRVAGKKVLMVASERCLELDDHPQTWREMVRLANWALERKRYGRISSVNAGVFGVLWGLLDFSAAETFCTATLDAIREHDRKSSSPLLPTLIVLLRHGGRLQPAADDLGVHITTVRYRLARIGELFSLDLRDGDTRFGLELALRLDRLLSSTNASAPGTI